MLLQEHWLTTDNLDELNSISTKFNTKKGISQVGGIIDNATIASNFATHFEKQFQPFSMLRNEVLKLKNDELRSITMEIP